MESFTTSALFDAVIVTLIRIQTILDIQIQTVRRSSISNPSFLHKSCVAQAHQTTRRAAALLIQEVIQSMSRFYLRTQKLGALP